MPVKVIRRLYTPVPVVKVTPARTDAGAMSSRASKSHDSITLNSPVPSVALTSKSSTANAPHTG